jgi:hypothetical protein
MPEAKKREDINWDAVAEPIPVEKRIREAPLDFQERFVLQNLFDTQPERRKAYLKQIGFEMNPKDTNMIRPMGSDSEFVKIDPGPIEAMFNGKTLAEKAKNYAKETGRDITDIFGDIAAGMLSQATAKGGAAFAKGAAAGSSPAGMMAAEMIGGITGGAIGTAAAEATKEKIGDIFLDENVPADKKLVAVQSIIGGIAPVLFQAGAKQLQKVYSGVLTRSVDSVKTAAKAATGNVSDELLENAAKNPDKWTPTAVASATDDLNKQFEGFFGVKPTDEITVRSTRQLKPDSFIGKIVSPLNKAADDEMRLLSMNPEADWKAGDMIGKINRVILDIESNDSPTVAEKAALKYFYGKKEEVLNIAKKNLIKTGVKPPEPKVAGVGTMSLKSQQGKEVAEQFTEDQLMQTPLNFKQGRNILKTMQDDAFNREVEGAPAIALYAGNLRRVADEKAAALGSKLPEINAKRAQLLDIFNNKRKSLMSEAVIGAYAPGKNNKAKATTRAVLDELSQLSGMPIADEFENNVLRSVFENAYKNTAPYASGRARAASINEAIKQGTAGGAAGLAIGSVVPGIGPLAAGAIGVTGGAIKGYRQGALMANPEYALKELSSTALKAKAAEEAVNAPLGAFGQTLVQGATAATKNAVSPEELAIQQFVTPPKKKREDIEW